MFQQLKNRLGSHDRLLAKGTSVAITIYKMALLIMAAGNVTAALASPLGSSISMMGRPQYSTINSLIMLIMMTGLCYYLIPTMGINGAAIAYAVSNGFVLILCLGQVFWLYRMESFKTAHA